MQTRPLLFELFFFHAVCAFPFLAFLLPDAVIAARDGCSRLFKAKNMFAAAVQYGAVVRYEEKSALCGKIACERSSARAIQMIGRLVEERKAVGREQDGKL